MQPHFYEPKKLKQLIAIAAAKAGFDTKDKSEDSEYRILLKRLANQTSTSKMGKVQLIKVLHHFQERGFKITAAKSKKKNPAWLSKLISLWSELHERGFVRDNRYSALESWAIAQLSTYPNAPQKLEWMSKFNNDLIERLKRYAHRCYTQNIINEWNAFLDIYESVKDRCNANEMAEIERIWDVVSFQKYSYQEALETYDSIKGMQVRFKAK